MPMALATAATERSISPVRMTKVRPTAMIEVSETWARMLAKLPSVMNDGLVIEKNTNSAISVINGAMLRNWLRRKCARSNRLPARLAISVMCAFLVHTASFRLAQDLPPARYFLPYNQVLFLTPRLADPPSTRVPLQTPSLGAPVS